jgi:hypothetical protein
MARMDVSVVLYGMYRQDNALNIVRCIEMLHTQGMLNRDFGRLVPYETRPLVSTPWVGKPKTGYDQINA